MLRPIHFEIHVDDAQRAMKFYRDVFKWKFTQFEDSPTDYWTIETGSKEQMGINGGMLNRPCPKEDTQAIMGAVITMDVPSVDEYITKITEAGGTEAMPKFAIPGMAWVAYYKDTEGNTFGIFENNPKAK